MIHSLEHMNRKELVEIVKIQIEEYQELTKKLKTQEWLNDDLSRQIHDPGLTDENIGHAIHKMIKQYKDRPSGTFEWFATWTANEYYTKADESRSEENEY